MEAKEWMTKLEEYRQYFETTPLPPGPLKIGNHATVNDVKKYVDTNLTVAAQKPGSVWFEGSMQRLQELKEILEQNIVQG